MGTNYQNKKILIVEDDISSLEILVDKFTREAFNVLQAKNGIEGLEVALKEHPDLILLDIIMPKMDGISMIKELQEDEWGKDVPIIILTNLSDGEKVAEAIERGVQDFLVKSDWNLNDVVKRVKKKLRIG